MAYLFNFLLVIQHKGVAHIKHNAKVFQLPAGNPSLANFNFGDCTARQVATLRLHPCG